MKKIFCERLRAARGSLSQGKAAKRLGISQVQLSRYESGKLEPGLETLSKIAKLFHVPLDYLLGVTDDCPAPGGIIQNASGGAVAAVNSRVEVGAASGDAASLRVEVERLRGEVAALERALALFAGRAQP